MKMRMRALAGAALIGGITLAGHAQTEGDASAGAEKIAACAACHGEDGQATNPIYPNLAGQSAIYLESALKAYRADNRSGGQSAMMTPQAKLLSDEDIADIAAYYSQKNP